MRDEMARLYGEQAVIDVADIFVELRRWPFRCFPRWYARLCRWRSVPWGMSYHLTNHADVMETASSLSYPYLRPNMRQFLQRHRADVIVSLHPAPNYALAHALERERLRVPFVIAVLDLISVHAGWFAPGARRYFVPTPEAKSRGLKWGVPSGRVEVIGGMPVRRAFVEARQITRAQARSELGLAQDVPMVLILGGGDGMGPMESVVRSIAALRPRATLVAIAGRNQTLYERLTELDVAVPLRIERYVPNMAVWMRAADILVTKAGPNSLTEAFLCELPVVLYAALLGQEEGNVAWVVENRAGIWAPRPRRAARAVMQLLADPERRQAMSERGKTLVRGSATERLARRLWAIGQESESVGSTVPASGRSRLAGTS
jgi:1,2-diacylglycerol 3-beta-galactosyltransferase